ncbi:MAG TPA: glycosyltransferase family 4 protein [Rhodanobacteraceae bacterium]|nr:glycosyltransferase family 4 protein [Rhodanobacteraceae bacterium]
MTASQPFRIAVVNSHPIQYFAPLYAYLNRDPEIEVTALYCSDFSLRGAVDPGFKQQVKWDVDLLSGYRHVFLGERAKQRSITGFWSLICPEIWGEIRSGRYDAVWLHGYAYAAFVLAFLAAKSCGLPVFVRSETHLGLQRPGWRQRLRDGILKRAYRHVDGFLAIGTANRDYYRALGVPDTKIFDVPYTVDNDRFIAAAALTVDERRDVRERFGLRDELPVVLYASKFMRRKHPDNVIEAMAKLRDEGIRASLLLVGTGEMEAALRARVAALNLDNVVFGGFVNQGELPRVYAAADVFVLPSENEPWGLIVNEVMCAGLPVVVSAEVGCVPDLVKDGGNGRHMRAGDVDSLATALRHILTDEAARRAMGRQSLEMINRWNYAKCSTGVAAAARRVCA